MKITLVKVCSGFANIPDDLIHAGEYLKKPVSSRPGSGYDTVIHVELSEGYSLSTNNYDDPCIVSSDGFIENFLALDEDGFVCVEMKNFNKPNLDCRDLFLKPL